MAKNRIVFAQRTSSLADYDTALIADFEARGWMVTTFANGAALPADGAYYDDVAFLVMGAPGTNWVTHVSDNILSLLPVSILTLCRGTAISALQMGTNYGANSVSTLTRVTGVTDPRALYATATDDSATCHVINPTGSGVTPHYLVVTSRAGVCLKSRTVSGTTYQDVFWGYHRLDLAAAGSNMRLLFAAYSGGTDDSTREVRASLPSPLGDFGALISVDGQGHYRGLSPLGRLSAMGLAGSVVQASLASPLGILSANVATGGTAYLSLPSPLTRRPTVLIYAAPAVLARLRSPLGSLSALAATGGQVWAVLPSPLGALRALVRLPLDAVPAAPMAARPRLLSDPLPLRSSTDLPSYRTDALLPWVYGTVTLAPLPWDAAGMEWLLADHPISAVHWVQVDGARIDGWALVQTTDALGHAVSLLRLTRPAEAAPAVALSGRRHPVTGAIVQHPADIADDLLRQCGWTVDADVFLPLREAWPDVALGGVISAADGLREAITRVVGMLGADWSAAPLRAWVKGSGPSLATLGPAQIDDGSASAEHGGLATVLRVAYGHDWAAGEPRGSMILEAADAIAAYGRIDADLDLGWVRAARDALALGTIALREMARPRWSISVAVAPGTDWRPGDRVTLAHPWLPLGAASVTAVAQDQASMRLALDRPAGPVPAISMAGRGALDDATPAADLGVAYSNGVATFTILDATGLPLADAAVTLDLITTRTTDRQGRVQFRTTRGAHSLRVVAAGYATMELEVVV